MPKTYNRERHRRQQEACIERWLAEISPANQDDVRGYHRLKVGQGAKLNSRQNIVRALWVADNALNGKRLRDLDENDATMFLAQQRLARRSDATIDLYRTHVLAFLRWALDTDSLPRRLKQAFRLIRNGRLPDRPVLTAAEEEALMGACETLRDQAIMGCLLEFGYRKGEVGSLRVGAFEPQDDGGARMQLPTDLTEGLKTGPRGVTFYRYAALVHAYLSQHPQRDDPQAPLWLHQDSYGRLQPGRELGPTGIYEVVRRARLRAGLRHFRVHDLRHTSATKARESGLDLIDLEERYGWAPGSKVARRYIHTSQAHKDRMARRAAGIDEAGLVPLGPAAGMKSCPMCAEDVKAAALKCKHCGEVFVRSVS